ncbi:hypothetical protein ACFQ7F_35150 [Streptomyces sp. NPDC056486]|uniref:hypothetical protein n=1 Tax=Streptomyces sp. NPDC056486 TaxID=3345835 RepID=UPI00367A9BB5
MSTVVLARRLAARQIPIRQTPLIELAQDLPPAILAPMLGPYIITVPQGRHRAATDWTAYLEARSRPASAGDLPGYFPPLER